jgi:hypothetical protein
MKSKSGTELLQIGQFTVTLDAEDLRRVRRETWLPTIGDGGAIMFYRDRGGPGQPVFQFLHNFVTDAPPNVPVSFVDTTKFFDLRKSNLRIG